MRRFNIVNKRSSLTQRTAEVDNMGVEPMQCRKNGLTAKAFSNRHRAQFFRVCSSTGKTEDRIGRSANAGLRAESLGYHPNRAGSVANVEGFSSSKTVTERRHHQRTVAANRRFNRRDQQIEPLMVGHLRKLRRHHCIGMHQNEASRLNADGTESVGDGRRCDDAPTHVSIPCQSRMW